MGSQPQLLAEKMGPGHTPGASRNQLGCPACVQLLMPAAPQVHAFTFSLPNTEHLGSQTQDEETELEAIISRRGDPALPPLTSSPAVKVGKLMLLMSADAREGGANLLCVNPCQDIQSITAGPVVPFKGCGSD